MTELGTRIRTWSGSPARRGVPSSSTRALVIASWRPSARSRSLIARSSRRAGQAFQRFAEPRALTLSPAWSSLLAAGLVGIGVFAGVETTNRDGRPTAGQPPVAAVSQLPVSDTFVKFTFVAPSAKHVTLVGDFNDWDVSKTPMAASGRHLDGRRAHARWAPSVLVRGRRKIVEQRSQRPFRAR